MQCRPHTVTSLVTLGGVTLGGDNPHRETGGKKHGTRVVQSLQQRGPLVQVTAVSHAKLSTIPWQYNTCRRQRYCVVDVVDLARASAVSSEQPEHARPGAFQS